MAVFKCKMCGGTLEVQPGESVAVCDSCGTKQTLPKLDDERRANLYDRASHFRRNGEFDKAEGIFESILAEDNTDAEAYWSLVLCKYGISYVEDMRTHKRVPTVNRAQYTPVSSDENYISAVNYADGYQRDIYEMEAKQIDKIQKGILAISSTEEPFDVFICYKDSDDMGKRTRDSVFAQDIYEALTEAGLRVFFSRITLENVLGSEYEPYIFAALNSAKVMLAVGTSQENLESVWVKNEWSRYLQLMGNTKGKTLIPCFADMSPYDLPPEMAVLTAQDMTKIGFMHDLVRGVKKICSDKEQTAGNEALNRLTAPLLEKAFSYLENGDWAKAELFLEQVLAQNPQSAQAYVGKLLLDLGINRPDQLKDYRSSIDDNECFIKAVEYGDESMKKMLFDASNAINEAIEKDNAAYVSKRKKRIRLAKIVIPAVAAAGILAFILIKIVMPDASYKKAFNMFESSEYKEAALLFGSLNGYKDSEQMRSRSTVSVLKSSDIAVGDEILFGTYEQDNKYKTGTEAIEWLVLDKQDDNILLVSKYCLDAKPYNDKYEYVTWEDCTLREWLNIDFCERAFTDTDKELLVGYVHDAVQMEGQTPISQNSSDSGWTGDDKARPANTKSVRDTVFLLSANEVLKYFESYEARRCTATAYAVKKGAYAYDVDGGHVWWWIRSISSTGECRGGVVMNNGEVATGGCSVDYSQCGIRPAVWINTKK